MAFGAQLGWLKLGAPTERAAMSNSKMEPHSHVWCLNRAGLAGTARHLHVTSLERLALLTALLLGSKGWCTNGSLQWVNVPKGQGRSCKASSGHAEITQPHFYCILLVLRMSLRPAQVQGEGDYSSSPDEWVARSYSEEYVGWEILLQPSLETIVCYVLQLGGGVKGISRPTWCAGDC